jgi:hypothetical protein
MEAMPRQCGREANEFALPKRIGLIDLFDWTFSVGRDTCVMKRLRLRHRSHLPAQWLRYERDALL